MEQLLQDVEKYTLASHLFWGLWGIISVFHVPVISLIGVLLLKNFTKRKIFLPSNQDQHLSSVWLRVDFRIALI